MDKDEGQVKRLKIRDNVKGNSKGERTRTRKKEKGMGRDKGQGQWKG